MQRLGEKTDTAGKKKGQEVNYECGRNTHSLKCQCWKKTGISKQHRTRTAHRQEAAGDSSKTRNK